MTSDPLNTTPWKPLEQNWGEGETVIIVHDRDTPIVDGPEDEPGPVRAPSDRTRGRAPVETGPARLISRDNAVDNHAQRVAGVTTALKAANDFLSLPKTGARDWAADLRYGDDIITRINEAVTAIHEALDLIDIHENG